MLLAEYRVSERRACATVFLQRSVYRYLDQPRDDRAVRQRMKEIAETRVRYGFNRIHILLRREGWRDNHKRTYRIYKEEGKLFASRSQPSIDASSYIDRMKTRSLSTMEKYVRNSRQVVAPIA